MPSGILLCGWDNTIGTIVVKSFPPEITLDNEKSIQCLLALQQIGHSHTIQIQDDSQTVMVYGIPTCVTGIHRFNLNFIILYLEKEERDQQQIFKKILEKYGEKVILSPRDKQINLFDLLVKLIWSIKSEKKKQNQRKIEAM